MKLSENKKKHLRECCDKAYDKIYDVGYDAGLQDGSDGYYWGVHDPFESDELYFGILELLEGEEK